MKENDLRRGLDERDENYWDYEILTHVTLLLLLLTVLCILCSDNGDYKQHACVSCASR